MKHKAIFILLVALSIFAGVTGIGASDPVVSAIKGIESTLYFLVAIVLFVLDDKRGK